MAANYAYTDTTGRKITQTAYDAQAKAGTDVSKYTKIGTAPVVNTQPVQQPANDMLSKVKELPQYQDLLGKGYTEEQIAAAVGQYKPKQTTETQVQPQPETTTDTTATPAEQTTATPTETTPTEQKKDTTAPDLLPVSDYMDDSEARQQGIVSNLNGAVQTNPQSLKDQKSFRDYYNYAGRSDLQKKTLDTWYQGYTKGNELSYKDTNEIYKQYDNGVLTTSDLSNLNIVNPTKYAEVKALIDKKNTMATYAEDLYGAEATTNPFQAIIDNYTKGLQTLSTSNFYNDYKEAMNSAGIKEQKLAIADKQTEIDKIDKQINEKKLEIEKRYEGKGATAGKIGAIVADELESLYSMRSNLAIDMNGAISKYNAEAGSIKEDFEMKQAEQQYNMQIKQQQMSELGFAMQLMSYETPAQQDERAWNTFIRQQEYTDGNIYSSDPKTRLRAIEKAVDNTLKEFEGIPMVRSRDQMVNDIKNIVEQGGDLGDAITENIRKPVMNKPEYRLWSANKLGVSESALQLAGMNLGFDVNGNITLNQSISSSEGTGMKGAGARNNNPGNIKDTTFGSIVGKDSKGFAIFATPEDGFDALVEKIKFNQTNTKSKYYGKTILEYFKLYAPSTDGNNPTNYANSVAANLGVNVNTKISQLDPTKFAAQIAKHDSGYNYDSYGKGKSSMGEPTASELAYYEDGRLGIDPTGKKGITQARYNEIGEWKKQQSSVAPDKVGGIDYDTAFSLLSFPTAVKSDQENANIKKLADAGNIDAVKSKLINLATNNIEGAESKKDYQSTYTMLGTLDKIKGLLDKAKSLGVPTGYLTGKYEDIANKFGKSTNPEIARLGTTLRDQLDALRRGRSGAALTEFEESFYDSIFPSNGKNYNLNIANINGLKDSRNMIFRTYLENAYTSDIADQLLGSGSTQQATTPAVNYFSQFQSGVGSTTTIPSYFNYIIGN